MRTSIVGSLAGLAVALCSASVAIAATLQIDEVAHFVSRELFFDEPGSPETRIRKVRALCVSPDGNAAGVPECLSTPVFDHSQTTARVESLDGVFQADLFWVGGNTFLRDDPLIETLDALLLTFENDGDISTASAPSLIGLVDIPVVIPVIGGTDSTMPIFFWTLPMLPDGAEIDSVRIALTDRVTGEFPVDEFLAPTPTSFQVPASAGLVLGREYSLFFALADTRDGQIATISNTNTRSRSVFHGTLALPEPAAVLLWAVVLAAVLATGTGCAPGVLSSPAGRVERGPRSIP